MYYVGDLGLDQSAPRVIELQCTLCQTPVYTCLKWCGSTCNMCIHIKSHNIDMNDGDSEDEGEDNITDMGEK